MQSSTMQEERRTDAAAMTQTRQQPRRKAEQQQQQLCASSRDTTPHALRSHSRLGWADSRSRMRILLSLCFVLLSVLLLSSPHPASASLFPGLPLPIDSVSLCCSWWSMLPRDKFIFTTSDSSVWEYDTIDQQARRLYHVRQLFEPPVGAGFFTTQNWTNMRFNATTWWSEADSMYAFAGQKYWSSTRTARTITLCDVCASSTATVASP